MNTISILIFLTVVAQICCMICVADITARYVHVNTQFDVHSVQAWFPQTLAIDWRGNIWFSNAYTPDSILQIDRHGSHSATLRTDPVSTVVAIAVGGSNQLIYLADNRGRRIVLMNSANVEIASFPYHMPNEYGVRELLVDNLGIIYIIDDQNAHVWRMNPEGSPLSTIVSDPPMTPSSMAIDPNSVLYVADKVQGRIFQFSTHGDQLGILVNPLIGVISSFVVDSKFNLFMSTGPYADREAGVTKLSPDGVVLSFIPEFGLSLVLDAENTLYMNNLNGVILKFDCEMLPLQQFHPPTPFTQLDGMMIDPSGDLIVINEHSLLKFSSTASLAEFNSTVMDSRFASFGILGGDGYIYIADLSGSIIKLSSDGSFVNSSRFTEQEVGVGPFAVAPDGTVWIPTAGCRCIIQYSSDGKELKRLLHGTDPTKMFMSPQSLFIDPFSNLFVLDSQSMRLYKLSSNADLLVSIDLRGLCTSPASFTVDMHGDVYVADASENHFIRIKQDGSVIDYQFTEFLLSQPTIAVTADSVVYLSDSTTRFLALSPNIPQQSTSAHYFLLIVLSTSVGSLLLLVACGFAAFRLIRVDPLVTTEVSHCEESSTRHASRRDRTGRRGATVNFLHNYHDNLRLPIGDEDSADHVLYI